MQIHAGELAEYAGKLVSLRRKDLDFAVANDVDLPNQPDANPKYILLPSAEELDVVAFVMLSFILDRATDRDALFLAVDNLYHDLGYPQLLADLATYMPADYPSPTPAKLEAKIRERREELLQRITAVPGNRE